MATMFIVRIAGMAFVGIGMLLTIFIDAYLSIGITATFLTPWTDAIGLVRARGNEQAHKSLQRTKHSALFGSSIAVFSSTLFYINSILWVMGIGPFVTSPWLNPLVFGANLDSILNDIGVFLLSGAWQQLPVLCREQAGSGTNNADISNSSNRPVLCKEQEGSGTNNADISNSPSRPRVLSNCSSSSVESISIDRRTDESSSAEPRQDIDWLFQETRADVQEGNPVHEAAAGVRLKPLCFSPGSKTSTKVAIDPSV
jgi:hypothetical protein